MKPCCPNDELFCSTRTMRQRGCAGLQAKRHKLGAARELYRRALHLDPSNVLTLSGFALFESRCGRVNGVSNFTLLSMQAFCAMTFRSSDFAPPVRP